MKKTSKFICLCLLLTIYISIPSNGAKRTESSTPPEKKADPEISVSVKSAINISEKDSPVIKHGKKNTRAIKQEIKEKLKKSEGGSGLGTVLLVIIAILLPPLAVLLIDGLKGPFWLSILLTLLFYVPGLIYALYRIFKR